MVRWTGRVLGSIRQAVLPSLLGLVLFLGLAYGLPTTSVDTPGHIRINPGHNAGLAVSPTTIEFGNVTAGVSANVTITVKDTGSCKENVTITATMLVPANITAPHIYSPFTMSPGESGTVLATYPANETSIMAPGDYSFNLHWTAVCV